MIKKVEILLYFSPPLRYNIGKYYKFYYRKGYVE